MGELQVFNSLEFGQIRTVIIGDEPWFVGKDIAEALGYSNTKDAIATHITEEDKQVIQKSEITTFEIPNRGMTIINESGLYALIFGSKLESAKRFKHWVTGEVLPSIRKTGSYQKQLSPQEMMRIQLGMIDNHEERIAKLEENTTIDYGQQRVLGSLVNEVVVSALGGKGSNAYREIGKKVFAECNKDIQRFFNVNSRNNVQQIRFNEAVSYIKRWKPCTSTQIMIENANAQLQMGWEL